MSLSEQARAALKAKAYIQDTLASLIPDDTEFDEVWALIPEDTAAKMDIRHAPLAGQFVDLADKVRAIMHRHAEARADKREG